MTLTKLQLDVLKITEPEIYKIFLILLQEIAALRERVNALESHTQRPDARPPSR